MSISRNIFKAMFAESNRQNDNWELIASENFVSKDIEKLMASCFTNKYCEGYPSKASAEAFQKQFPDYQHTGNCGRYYGGCENADMLELYCRYMWQKVFHTAYHVNVQPHSGSQANMAAYMSVLQPGDTILAMSLENGGHLTHGASANFSGKIYNMVFYGVTEDGHIDYDDLEEKLRQHQPRLVLAGASAYSRVIDFRKIRKIIDRNSDENYHPYFMVDMAHIAGLIAAGCHPSPFGYADIITTTTHKTLRGPRGGMIFCKPELAKKVDSAVFPGTQGGPLMHVIAAKAKCAEEALEPAYKQYIHQVVLNTKAMAGEMIHQGFKLVTGGTDNHLFLLDLTDTGLTGKEVQEELDCHGITANKNCVPNETRSPQQASGLRIGLAAMTTKGWDEEKSILAAKKIAEIIRRMQS